MSTPASTPAPKRPRRRNKTILPVAAASMVAFLGLTGFLGAQMAEGKDPLVGSGKQATAQVQAANVKKVIITRKVIVKKDAAPAASGGTAAATPAATYSAPVQQSAPAQPAPAPAPVQSGTS
jgi:cytoskeletal protein RodZ